MQPAEVTLIVCTYNRPEALRVCLESVREQKLFPQQTVIADDGSSFHTRELVEDFMMEWPKGYELVHCWQPDLGFRKAGIMNRAIALSDQEYLIGIDGDLVLHPDFISDHVKFAQKGFFVQGGRVLLEESLTHRILEAGKMASPSSLLWHPAIRKRHKMIRFAPLRKLHRWWATQSSQKGVRGCNMAFWRNDILAVNGLNEEFKGWGYEDRDLVQRLLNLGIARRNLRYGAVTYHLYHEHFVTSTQRNLRLYECSLRDKMVIKARFGLKERESESEVPIADSGRSLLARLVEEEMAAD